MKWGTSCSRHAHLLQLKFPNWQADWLVRAREWERQREGEREREGISLGDTSTLKSCVYNMYDMKSNNLKKVIKNI